MKTKSFLGLHPHNHLQHHHHRHHYKTIFLKLSLPSFLQFLLLLYLTPSSHGANPIPHPCFARTLHRPRHPDGPIPTTERVVRNLPSVCDTLFPKTTIDRNCNDDDDDDNGGNASRLLTPPPVVLIDGNNIRNTFGHGNVDALDLTRRLSSFSYSSFDNIKHSASNRWSSNCCCAWDGGGGDDGDIGCLPTGNSTLALFSGPDMSADDLIVQCCAFLRHRWDRGIGGGRDVVVFTSDTNLANRCWMQTDEGEGKIRRNGYVFHSAYLCRLLDPNVDVERRTWEEFGWEREERRASVEKLRSWLTSEGRVDMEQADGTAVLRDLKEWIDGGRPGLEIGRVTKSGSVLYRVREESL